MARSGDDAYWRDLESHAHLPEVQEIIREENQKGTIRVRPNLDGGLNRRVVALFLVMLCAGVVYTAYSLYADVSDAGITATSWVQFGLLGLALVIALHLRSPSSWFLMVLRTLAFVPKTAFLDSAM